MTGILQYIILCVTIQKTAEDRMAGLGNLQKMKGRRGA